MTKQFKLTRDTTGEVSFGLSMANMRMVGALLATDTYCYFDIQDNDKYVFFFPSVSANYMVSNAVPVAPTLVTNGAAIPVNGLLNIAHIDLVGWKPDPLDLTKTRVYVWSLNATMWISLAIGS